LEEFSLIQSIKLTRVYNQCNFTCILDTCSLRPNQRKFFLSTLEEFLFFYFFVPSKG
jgi:hypothetical protein